MSVEKGFETSSPEVYRTSKTIINKLRKNNDLYLVNPTDYDVKTNTINNAYKLNDSYYLEKVIGKHVPKGDLFIIYGDETSKDIGLDFAKKQYAFLKNLKASGNFSNYLNNPETEEKTMKDYLVNLTAQGDKDIGATYFLEDKNQVEALIKKYGELVVKPIFGCRGAGIFKVNNVSELENKIGFDKDTTKKYVLQEPLAGPEKRIVFLNDNLLCSRIHYNRPTPWNTSDSNLVTKIYEPTKKELDISKKYYDKLEADILGIDFIGDKINELNGTGTGLIIYDHNDELLYDYTDSFVGEVDRLLRN